MILQSLVKLYDTLVEKGTLEKPGWLPVKVAWGLDLDDDGHLLRVVPLEQEVTRGKKTILSPQIMKVPAPVKRTMGVVPNFLCDNASYVLGVDQKNKPERARQCFQALGQYHRELLAECDHPAAMALLRFLDTWQPENAIQNPVLDGLFSEVTAGGNIVFCHRGLYLHEIPELKDVWQAAYDDDADVETMQCLVTGRRAPVAVLHPSIKGVMGAQSSGASLVSYNATALESFEKSQGLNAPVSTQAAFAYGAALNYLLSTPEHHLRMGDTTVVFWAENGAEGYAQFLMDMFGTNVTDQQIKDILQAIAAGRRANWNEAELDPDNRFCILGLAPNAARLSVRFFLCDRFGTLMTNVHQHQRDLEIIRPAYDEKNELSIYWLLQETVNQKSKDKAPHPQMAGDVMRAILLGSIYPATVYEQVHVRIRAERVITRGRAAIIKAYLTRQPNFMHKEVLTVQLNEESNYQPYLLGRLFAVLEGVQEKANPGINATIRDRYFSSACATPAIVFPTLIRLSQAHLKKLEGGLRIYYDKQIGDILQMFDQPYPARLSLQDQGVFHLGYYHQTQRRYTKKEDKKNG